MFNIFYLMNYIYTLDVNQSKPFSVWAANSTTFSAWTQLFVGDPDADLIYIYRHSLQPSQILRHLKVTKNKTDTMTVCEVKVFVRGNI